jgi:hypothetical protein
VGDEGEGTRLEALARGTLGPSGRVYQTGFSNEGARVDRK